MAQQPFTDVTGYQDPYEEARRKQAAYVAQLQAAQQAPKPMYSPQEVQQRQADYQRMLLQGQVGMLANDKSIGGIAQPMLKRSMEALSPKYTDHGQFDETTGKFTYFPGVQETRKLDAARRETDIIENRSAQARASYDLAAMRTSEAANLRKTLAGMKGREDKGSLTYVGTDVKSNPIYLHSKRGLTQKNAEGEFIPYTGQVSPKIAEAPAAIQSNYLQNRAALEQVDVALKMLEENPEAVGKIGYLPNAVSQYIPGKVGAGGVGVRAAVADLGSLKIHDRSGAAVTASEFPRLRPFIPNVGLDSPAAIKTKLEGFKRTYTQIQSEIEAGYPLSRVIGVAHQTPQQSSGQIGQGAAPTTPQQPRMVDW